jgi:hypothetical protein
MSTETVNEQRLAALERAVTELQQRLENSPPTGTWLQRFSGAFKDEPAFEEVVAYGRAIRSEELPVEDDGQ